MISIEEKNTLLVEFLESMGYLSFPSNGSKVINRYSDLDAEMDSLYNGVALRNISHLGLIERKGKDSRTCYRINRRKYKEIRKFLEQQSQCVR